MDNATLSWVGTALPVKEAHFVTLVVRDPARNCLRSLRWISGVCYGIWDYSRSQILATLRVFCDLRGLGAQNGDTGDPAVKILDWDHLSYLTRESCLVSNSPITYSASEQRYPQSVQGSVESAELRASGVKGVSQITKWDLTLGCHPEDEQHKH